MKTAKTGITKAIFPLDTITTALGHPTTRSKAGRSSRGSSGAKLNARTKDTVTGMAMPCWDFQTATNTCNTNARDNSDHSSSNGHMTNGREEHRHGARKLNNNTELLPYPTVTVDTSKMPQSPLKQEIADRVGQSSTPRQRVRLPDWQCHTGNTRSSLAY